MRLRFYNADLDHSTASSSGGDGGEIRGTNERSLNGRSTNGHSTNGRSRLNLLLTYGGWRENAFADQLPILLERFGIQCFRAESGDEATDVIRRIHMHIAVIDLSIPMHPVSRRSGDATGASDAEVIHSEPAGGRVLQLLKRLDQPPPTIVVRPRQPDPAESSRTLADALRDGAFAVLDDPVPIESMLQVLERVVRRHYRDHWPAA